MKYIVGKKVAFKIVSSIIGAAIMSLTVVSTVFAVPTRGPEIDCNHIRWEMQNETNISQTFTGRVTSPIDFTISDTVAPGYWGVFDIPFSNLSGNVLVSAWISMGGDNRNITHTLDCAAVAAIPSQITSASPSPSPVAASGTSNVTLQPETGPSVLSVASMLSAASLGFALTKYRRSKPLKVGDLAEIAQSLIEKRKLSRLG